MKPEVMTMLNINPLLLVGGVIGAVTALLIFAYASVKDKKTAMGFERTMADGEILRRLFAYAKPYWAKFLLVLFLMLFSIAYDIISPLIVGAIEELVAADFALSRLFASVAVYAGILVFSMASTYFQAVILQRVGQRIISDLLFSIPLFIFSVFLFRWFGNKYPQFIVPYEIDRSKYTEAQLKVLDKIDAKIKAGKELENEDFTELLSTEKLPSAGLSFTILLLPVFLILANTLVSQTAFKATIVGEIITFLGNPVIALFISLCLGAFLLAKDLDNKTVVGMMNDALRDAGPIVMITAGGGALGAVVKATGAAGMMANGIVAIGIPGILVPLLIGTIMRFPQGSGTTAMITGSAIIAPMLVTLGINPYLAGLAVCLTAMCPSFLNDSYFHVVTSFSGMDIKTSLKTWTIGSILVPIFGSVIICILSLFIH